MKLDVQYVQTSDGLKLQGMHYDSSNRELCVLVVHGMSGNFIENDFADVLGKTLATNKIGMLYGHNRGYNHINDITTKNGKTIRVGAMYERFTDCVFDIEAWVNKVNEFGYKKIILLGHSLGCNKTIHYFSSSKPQNIVGVILASPPDMVGLFEKTEYQPNHKELLAEAKQNVNDGNPRKLVSGMVWDWYNLSSQTYIDLSQANGAVDNLPVRNSSNEFSELASINVPILGIMGEFDDIAINTLSEDLDLIASKATGTPSFTKKFIKGANHTYENEEQQFSDAVLEWIKAL